jgi:hypothetical protein
MAYSTTSSSWCGRAGRRCWGFRAGACGLGRAPPDRTTVCPGAPVQSARLSAQMPVQPEFNNWAFNVARGAAIRRYWTMVPENTDILVTHGHLSACWTNRILPPLTWAARNWQRPSNRLSLGFMCLATSTGATGCPSAKKRNLSTRQLSMRHIGSFMSRKLSRSRFDNSKYKHYRVMNALAGTF